MTTFGNVQKCSKVWVPLSKLSFSKNVRFTNAILGPLDFIHSEMLKRGMGGSGPSGKQPVETTISGAGPPLGATKGYQKRTFKLKPSKTDMSPSPAKMDIEPANYGNDSEWQDIYWHALACGAMGIGCGKLIGHRARRVHPIGAYFGMV